MYNKCLISAYHFSLCLVMSPLTCRSRMQTLGSALSRTVLLVSNAAKAISNPDDGAAVAAVGELTAIRSAGTMLSAMLEDKDGRYLLRQRPRISDDTLKYAETLQVGTVGKAYAVYMQENGFLPSGRAPIRFIEDENLSYVVCRYREVHDFLHVITGCDRTVLGELALKGFEYSQSGIPLGLLSIAGGAPHLTTAQRHHLTSKLLPWAADHRVGGPLGSRFFLNVVWEDELSTPLDDLRRRLSWKCVPE